MHAFNDAETENYGNKYFTSENASKIGYIRNDIECLKNHGEVNQREYTREESMEKE